MKVLDMIVLISKIKRENNVSDIACAQVGHVISLGTCPTEFCDFLLCTRPGEFLHCLRCVPPRKLRARSEVNEVGFRMRIIQYHTDTTPNLQHTLPKGTGKGIGVIVLCRTTQAAGDRVFPLYRRGFCAFHSHKECEDAIRLSLLLQTCLFVPRRMINAKM